jgi:hypothetical protein
VVTVELAPGVEARLTRRAISGKVTPAEQKPDEPDEPGTSEP